MEALRRGWGPGQADVFRGISFILSSIVFHVIPTALEITMVCGILVCLSLALFRLHSN
jgi:ABC-type transport system involved in Fe-S cluster assembly fused permease/ATPase subunit